MTAKTEAWYKREKHEQAEKDKASALKILERDIKNANTEFAARRRRIHAAYKRWTS